ncbi:MAG: hypothetical protein NXI24_24625 [bacterium]|nr:hypothetical protein [bacterium]
MAAADEVRERRELNAGKDRHAAVQSAVRSFQNTAQFLVDAGEIRLEF